MSAPAATRPWILAGGLAMGAIAMVGGLTTLLCPETLVRLLLPLVALAAGTLLGGALFHMIPEGTAALAPLDAAAWLASRRVEVAGLVLFGAGNRVYIAA